ncbi:hypothetical protein Acid345_3332 [Candidatus Koribacter versatilis Ellin345]|uniref:DinB-like domain-containing protein n=1 Tax=Koribacter versatilis (strain Ellin345) TaxID=204669 RepID=Q1ILB7_KORVE|nr:DinB family protein [Candidatus Koribacter versatilis]ABF42333.1 hypothetical protein Acid345_3332 [Candidatus Koribacter versatilis Ellin345]
MKKVAIVLTMALALCCGCAIAQDKGPAKTVADVFNGALTGVENEFVPAAEAMPEGKYDFAPTSGEFKGVRTFGQQVKHVAAVNYVLGAAILGEKPPVDLGGESGPESVKSKADIVKFLKDSFAYAHKALATLDEKNVTVAVKSPFGPNQMAKGTVAVIMETHPFDHYGQMAVYLRMNGIIPPASRQ